MLKELKTHHREIARLKFEGFKPAEIAERTGNKLATVYNILRDALCKSYMNGLSDRADSHVINVRQELAEMSQDSLSTIQYMIDSANTETIPASVRLAAANSVLDRNGYKAPEEHKHAVLHFTADDLKELSNRAKAVNTDYLN